MPICRFHPRESYTDVPNRFKDLLRLMAAYRKDIDILASVPYIFQDSRLPRDILFPFVRVEWVLSRCKDQ